MTHKNCILCNAKLPESFLFRGENMPASAQDLPEAFCDTGLCSDSLRSDAGRRALGAGDTVLCSDSLRSEVGRRALGAGDTVHCSDTGDFPIDTKAGQNVQLQKAAFISSEKAAGVTLTLKKCPKCGLVQFDCEPVGYYRDVIRAVGLSDTMKNIRRNDYFHLIEKYGLSGKKWIECGCGNGDFLKVLSEYPVEIYGMENNAENVQTARDGLILALSSKENFSCEEKKLLREKIQNRIMNIFTESADMKIPGGPFDCFLSFNFLEHQPDPCTMLKCMYENLSDGGYGLITVPSFEYIINENHYYELIRDHIANYNMYTLEYLCRTCGFTVLEKGFIGIGDTLRVVVRKDVNPENNKKQSELSPCREIDDLSALETDRQNGKVYSKVSSKEAKARPCRKTEEYTDLVINNGKSIIENEDCSLEKNRIEVNRKISAFIEKLKSEGKTLALFGAGHQGFTICSTTELKDYAECFIDNAKFKQGKFAPASYLKIISVDEFLKAPADVVLIVAPGYVKEIKKSLEDKINKAINEKIIANLKESVHKLKNIEIISILDIC